MRRDRYLPIAEYGIIGDLRSVALVATDGSIDWFCPDRFDAPSLFGRLLDSRQGGYFQICPQGKGWVAKQLYLPDTNILVTRFLTDDGMVELEDLMPITGGSEPQRILRLIRCVRGEVPMRLEFFPAPDYARLHVETAIRDREASFEVNGEIFSLQSPTPLEISSDATVVSDFTLRGGEERAVALLVGGEPLSLDAWREARAETERYWKSFASGIRYRGRWREAVIRSALVLKLLTYRPTGALVAAATTSLPERIGGARNWDYRFSWIRDSAYTLYAFLSLGLLEEAATFGGWMRRLWMESDHSHPNGPLRVLYRVDGSAQAPEEVLDHLDGYCSSRPVRIGNQAVDQFQLDTYGALLDAGFLAERAASEQHSALLTNEAWQALSQIVDWLCEHWQEPDEGIWEVRSGRHRFTYSALMSWTAFDRAMRLARHRAFPCDYERWRFARDGAYRFIFEKGWSEAKQSFVQAEGLEAIDSSLLMMPLVHFIAPTDPAWHGTLRAIENELRSDALVYRYNAAASDDGVGGEEGTFSICSFWLCEALARSGRLDEARLVFEKMLTYANHLGLHAEQIGPRGELLGNFPQAYTHLGLIGAAVRLDRLLDARALPPARLGGSI